MEYGKLQTELRNPRTMHIDRLDTLEMLRCIHEEDRRAVEAVGAVLPQIAPVIDRIAAGMAQGGRLIYTGCGTSGRLGVLDASECPPTYGVEPGLVIGVIAGSIATAAIVKKVPTMTVTPEARPSNPSVKLTPFTVPNTTINTKMIRMRESSIFTITGSSIMGRF